ncbi:MAG: transposase [Phycisphaerae bacterium]|nr:transposase [Phycisphaerae bacterium]
MDSSVSPTHGDQEASAYNGLFECTCHHPLFCFNQDGDLERVLLRNGNVHSADDWRLLLKPVVARYRDESIRKFFRADAAFANPQVYAFWRPRASSTQFVYLATTSCTTVSATC